MSFTVCRLFYVSRYKWNGAKVMLVDEPWPRSPELPSLRFSCLRIEIEIRKPTENFGHVAKIR